MTSAVEWWRVMFLPMLIVVAFLALIITIICFLIYSPWWFVKTLKNVIIGIFGRN